MRPVFYAGFRIITRGHLISMLVPVKCISSVKPAIVQTKHPHGNVRGRVTTLVYAGCRVNELQTFFVVEWVSRLKPPSVAITAVAEQGCAVRRRHGVDQ